jgi:hypothetical protein
MEITPQLIEVLAEKGLDILMVLEVSGKEVVVTRARKQEPKERPKPTPRTDSLPRFTPISTEEVRKRFDICKTCEHSLDGGFRCALWKSCCFGRYRTKAETSCPANPPKWGITVIKPGGEP